ncbi:uncharacterized protein [Lolium perenne]|uniref:uncharacterized protein n=1 Tax=Lolium perenne TaxID=4522 RepID=UPI0021F5E32F|nr:uncharacterized protein LOC127310458 [Lolium perenne]
MEGYCMLYVDYIVDDPLHDETVFRHRFRMGRNLFLKIVYALREYDSYFRRKLDCTGMAGFSVIQKCTVAMRMLAYGAPGDSTDDYLRMAESTVLNCFYRFYRAVIALFGDIYLRSPTEEEREVLFEFVVVLKGDPLGIERLPDNYADFVAGNEPASLLLREAACDCCRWIGDVIFDMRGKMYLHTGWEKFVRFDDLEAGCVLTCSYLGEGDMTVKFG